MKLFFEGYVTESATCLVACSRQSVVIFCRSELHGEKVLLCRSTANDECNMVRRASSSAEALHLFYEEWNESARILDTSLCLLIEISLVGRSSTLYYAEEFVLCSLCSLYVNLCWKVATGVHFIVHIERSIL